MSDTEERIEKIIDNQAALFYLLCSLAEELTNERPVVQIRQSDGSYDSATSSRTAVSWMTKE